MNFHIYQCYCSQLKLTLKKKKQDLVALTISTNSVCTTSCHFKNKHKPPHASYFHTNTTECMQVQNAALNPSLKWLQVLQSTYKTLFSPSQEYFKSKNTTEGKCYNHWWKLRLQYSKICNWGGNKQDAHAIYKPGAAILVTKWILKIKMSYTRLRSVIWPCRVSNSKS